MEETLDQISPLIPMDFFRPRMDLHFVEKRNLKKPLPRSYLFPNFSSLLCEESLAKVSGGWNESGLVFDFSITQPFEECFFPEYRKGDSIEILLDTRDLKSAGFLTRFCHHFVILPKAVENVLAQEVTSFRSEDRHDLCDPEKIEVEADFGKRHYFLKIFIPSDCLHGYDPKSFDRLGFAYRINRKGDDPEHFVVSSKYLQVEKESSLWPSFQMTKK